MEIGVRKRMDIGISVSRGTLPVRINIWVSVSAAVRVFWGKLVV